MTTMPGRGESHVESPPVLAVARSLTIWLTLVAATPALADEPAAVATAPAPRSGAPRWLPPAAAVVPGVVLHGSGHFAAGDRSTAWRLFAVEGVGVGALLLGGVGLAVTGASRRTIEPIVLTSAVGGGLLATSWLADLYGVLAPAGGTGDALRVVPSIEAQVGTRAVDNPVVPGRFFVGPSFDLRLGRWRLSPSGWWAVDGHSQSRVAATVAFRFVGPRPAGAPPAVDGSFLDLAAGVVHHRFAEDGGPTVPGAAFDMTTVDVRVEGRLDLRRVAASLTGSFVEGSAGVGLGAYHYPATTATDANTLLLARFAFGLDVGRRADRWGQARIFYDHRHDDFAGGLKLPGLGSGVLGYFGVEGTAYLTRGWGVRGEAQVGSAWVGGLAVVRRFGSVEL